MADSTKAVITFDGEERATSDTPGRLVIYGGGVRVFDGSKSIPSDPKSGVIQAWSWSCSGGFPSGDEALYSVNFGSQRGEFTLTLSAIDDALSVSQPATLTVEVRTPGLRGRTRERSRES